MIYSSDIFVPLLCPIQFLEPREQIIYKKQGYVGNILSDIYFQVFISKELFDSANNIHIKTKDARTGVTYDSADCSKRILLEASETTEGFYFCEGIVVKSDLKNCVYFELYSGDDLLADSIPYMMNPMSNKYLKEITYTHFENDYNGVFILSEFQKTFTIAVECGFIPNDFQSKTQREDFEQQDLMNDIMSGRPYAIEPITFGVSKGIPNWLAHKLNIIFLLSDVRIEGERLARAAGADIELVERTDNGLGVYRLQLQSYENSYLPFRIWDNPFAQTFN